MKIEFGDFEFTECWDGVLYKKLSGYPEMTDWEIQTVLDFIKYEKDNGCECELVGDENILAKVRDAIADRNRVFYERLQNVQHVRHIKDV